jgi:acyl-[acyl-carrier-protein]-phospholipid O-acyltransferase / long-chain-fatty-acid--[acyl-carrier-protein] ligase
VFAISFNLGSIGCARMSEGEPSARLVPLAAIGISVFCWDFASAATAAHGIASASVALRTTTGWRMLTDLLLLAVCGGLFSVPLYAIIQRAAEPSQRARMIAANNIMNALFMVLGAAAAAALAAAGFDAPETLRVATVANLIAAGWLYVALHRANTRPGVI